MPSAHPAFESSGESVGMQRCISFRRKSLTEGPSLLSPSSSSLRTPHQPRPWYTVPKPTGHHSMKEKNSASSSTPFSPGTFPPSPFCLFHKLSCLGAKGRAIACLASPGTSLFPKGPGPASSSLSQVTKKRAVLWVCHPLSERPSQTLFRPALF